MSDAQTSIPTSAKGKRPHVFEDPINDHLVAMILELASELWTVKDRQAALEAYMVQQHGMTAETLETLTLPDSDQATLSAERAAFIRRIFRTLESEI